MGTILVALVVLNFLAVALQIKLVEKFGRKIKNRLIFVSFPAIYILQIIYYFFTNKKLFSAPLLDSCKGNAAMYLCAPLELTIDYMLFVLTPSIFIYLFYNYAHSGELKKDFDNSPFSFFLFEVPRGFKEIVTNPIKDPTGYQSWIWTLSKIISLALTALVIYFLSKGFFILDHFFGNFISDYFVNFYNGIINGFINRLPGAVLFLIFFRAIIVGVVLFGTFIGLQLIIGGLFRIISLFIFNLLR